MSYYISYPISVFLYILHVLLVCLICCTPIQFLCHPSPLRRLLSLTAQKSEQNCCIAMSLYFYRPQIATTPYSKW